MAGRAGSLLATTARGGRRMEKWGQPLRVIAQDYIEVVKDAYKDAKARPIKTLLYSLIGCGVIATWKTRPDAVSYTDRILDHCNDLHQCSQLVRNPTTQAYLDNIMGMFAKDQLEYKNFGFFAILLKREHSPVCKNYHMSCKHLRRRWWTRWANDIVDVGAWGRWWALDRAMVDYDINDDELKDWLEKH